MVQVGGLSSSQISRADGPPSSNKPLWFLITGSKIPISFSANPARRFHRLLSGRLTSGIDVVRHDFRREQFHGTHRLFVGQIAPLERT